MNTYRLNASRLSLLSLLSLITLFLSSCGGDYTPKPSAYLRIDMPEHRYAGIADTIFGAAGLPGGGGWGSLPFTFEANTCAVPTAKDAPRGEVWLDLNYPQWNGVVFLTYMPLHSPGDLRGQVDTSSRLLEKHYQVATGIDEQRYDSDDGTVHAVTWRLRGSKVASTYQFYATDSSRHFLRGALFINQAPNNDSLAPVIEYLQADLDHLVETLRWRTAAR